MAEDQDTSEELFNSSEDEGGSPTVSTTDVKFVDQDEETESTDEATSEENEDALVLDEGTSDPAEEAKQRQLTSWMQKIESGEKSLDDLPKNQRWMKRDLEAKLNKVNKEREVEADYDIDEIVERKMKAKEDAQHFNSIKDQLNSTKLNAEQKATIADEFKDFRGAGLNKAKSLEKALKVAGVALTPDRRSRMTPPRPNTVDGSNRVDEDNWRETMSAKDRIKKLESLTR